ncbi:Eco57I restriction-modification methylase domain-containing protein [Clavibacter nebraskensis]
MVFARVTKSEGLRRVTDLVARYRGVASELVRPGSTYTETDVRVEFIDPLLECLGWDVRNQGAHSQRSVEVVRERTGRDADGSWGRPDYRLRLDGMDVMPIEAKKPSVSLATNASSSRQARSYGWSLSLPAAVLTNFHELIVFDSRVEPRETDGPSVAVLPGGVFGFEEFVTRFDELWRLVSYESLRVTGLEGIYDFARPPRGESPFDQRFLGDFRHWRQSLAQAVADGNPALGAPEVGRRAQSLLNALLFLRVCEDREIGRYRSLFDSARSRTLVEAFRAADRVYNAGLFNVLHGTTVDADVLMLVVEDMYWPRTQYAFGVLDASILAGVYEQYLAERVDLDECRRVTLILKPELVHAAGVVATPDDIVKEIGHQALGPALAEGVPEDLTVLDPAVGSGVFLLDAFDRLVEAAELARPRLSLAERGALVRSHLFGIDIDGAAVEVAKLSLQLAVLGNQDVDPAIARGVLPNLDRNIVVGNAVVREDFDALVPAAARVPHRRALVSPLDIKAAIGAAYPRRGFSVVLGNPPYVRIQDLARHMPDQLQYLQHGASLYDAPVANNFDLYLVFMERALELLAPDGRLGMIVPNRFASHLSASGVRRKLGPRLESMVHFGEQQVFPGRTTYTAIVVAGPKRDDAVSIAMVGDLEAWRTARSATFLEVERTSLGPATWPFATVDQTTLFGQLAANCVARLGDPGWVDIFVGVQTSADEWFFLKPIDDGDDAGIVEFIDIEGVRTGIEASLLKPALKDRKIAVYDGQPIPDRRVIFPYVLDSESRRMKLITEDVMRTQYPLAAKYFDRHRGKLQHGRNVSPDPGEAFWAFGRSQSLSKLSGPKLIARVMSLSPRYAVDHEGLVAPGGGDGGPYGFLRPDADCPYSMDVIQAILSHPVVDLMVSVAGKKYRGSYAVHRKEFLKGIPVPALSDRAQLVIEERVEELRDLAVQLRDESDTAIASTMKDRRRLLQLEVEELLSSAYQLDPELVARVLDPE